MNKRVAKRYWIWGLFEPSAMRELTQIKSQVNDALDGPNFDIHLTLSGPLNTEHDSLLERFSALRPLLEPIEVGLTQYAYTEKFYESLFIKVKRSEALLEFKETIDTAFNLGPKVYNPHISLFYGLEAKENKEVVISKLPAFSSFIGLSKLYLMDVSGAIDQWKVIRKITL